MCLFRKRRRRKRGGQVKISIILLSIYYEILTFIVVIDKGNFRKEQLILAKSFGEIILSIFAAKKKKNKANKGNKIGI